MMTASRSAALTAALSSAARGVGAHVGDGQFGGEAAAFADAGAGHDPLVGGVEGAGELFVGDDGLGQVNTGARHHDRQDRARERGLRRVLYCRLDGHAGTPADRAAVLCSGAMSVSRSM